MARIEIRIPAVMGDQQIDYSIDSGDITKWHKHAGDAVQKGELLLSFDVSKAVIDVPSPVSGVLVEIRIPEGRTISTKRWDQDQTFIAKVVAVIETNEGEGNEPSQTIAPPAEEGTPSPPISVSPLKPSSEAKEEKPAVLISPLARRDIETAAKSLEVSPDELVKKLVLTYPNVRLTREHVAEFLEKMKASSKEDIAQVPATEHAAEAEQKTKVIPPFVRKKARELGVKEEDLHSIEGTGPDGSLTASDVEKYAEGRIVQKETISNSPEPSKDTDKPKETDTPKPPSVSGKKSFKVTRQPSIRRTIARNMEEAWKKPTAQGTFRVNLSRLMLFKENYGKAFEEQYGVKLQVAFPLVAALVRVLAKEKFAFFNSMWAYEKDEEENLEIAVLKTYESVNLGVSFDTPKGLVVLTVKEANTFSLRELAKKLVELGKKAQTGTFTLQDQTGETFIFNNIGGLRKTAPEDLQDEKDRFEFLHETGFSILTPPISLEFNLGGIDKSGVARMQVCFDHRPIDGGHATEFAHEVYSEMFRIIREIEADLKTKK